MEITQLLFLFIMLPIFILLHHPPLSYHSNPPSISSVSPFSHFTTVNLMLASVVRTELVVDGTYGRSQLYPHNQQPKHQHLEALWSFYSLHGDLMLMATL